jgi:hypothetical protein
MSEKFARAWDGLKGKIWAKYQYSK